MSTTRAGRPLNSSDEAPRTDPAQLAARLAPCALLVCLWLAVIPPSGGYFPRTWYPAAASILLFFYVFRFTARAKVAEGRPLRVALVLFAVLVGWAFLSIAWADSPGSAWEAANKLVLVLGLAGTVALVAWTPGTLALLLGAWSVGVALLCAGRLITWLGASDLSAFFEPASARMSDPLGYPNATAALPAMALVPAVLLASLRQVPAWARAAMLPVAVFLVEFALFAQSRGAVGGALVAVLVLVALAGDRLRILVRLAVVLALAAPAARPVLDVGNAEFDGRSPVGPLHDAAPVIAVTVALAAVAGVVLAVLDGRLRVPRRVARGAATVAVAAAVVAAAAAGVAYGGAVRTWASEAWSTGHAPSGTQSRLLSLAPEERPDYARVALDAFADHPVAGIGAGNFGRVYDANRRFEKHSRYTHDIWLRILAEHGVVGIALFLGILAAMVTGLLVRRRSQSAYERSLVAGCFAVGAYFLAHGSLDWLEEFPALAMPAVGLPFAALALGAHRGRTGAGPAPVWRGRLATVGHGAALGAVLVSLVPAWLAVRYLDRARHERASNTAAAFRDIDRAGSLNRLSVDAPVAEGALALGLGQRARARAAFERANVREPNWFSYLQLSLLDAGAGRFDTAGRLLGRAAELDAQDPVIAEARARFSRHERVDPGKLNEKAMESPLFRRSQMP
jgi:tetratricopeptide (TPR) repeat protein